MKDSGQLTFQTMGGETVTVPVRGRNYVAPRGGADRPGTGPTGETCGTCGHIVRTGRSRSYPKCGLNSACWTHGPKTDIRVRWAACSKWEAPEADPATPAENNEKGVAKCIRNPL